MDNCSKKVQGWRQAHLRSLIFNKVYGEEVAPAFYVKHTIIDKATGQRKLTLKKGLGNFHVITLDPLNFLIEMKEGHSRKIRLEKIFCEKPEEQCEVVGYNRLSQLLGFAGAEEHAAGEHEAAAAAGGGEVAAAAGEDTDMANAEEDSPMPDATDVLRELV